MPRTFETFIADPRSSASAMARNLTPACNGGPWPDPDTTDASERHQIEFLAAYYHLNRLHQLLRDAGDSQVADQTHAAIVADLVQAIAFRDRLEDLCAPIGFDAEPEMQGHLAVNLLFRYARRSAPENHRRCHPQEARLKVPLPDPAELARLEKVAGIPHAIILADLNLGPSNHRSGLTPPPA